MAQDTRWFAGKQALGQMDVTATDADIVYLDHNLAGFGHRIGRLVQGEFGPAAPSRNFHIILSRLFAELVTAVTVNLSADTNRTGQQASPSAIDTLLQPQPGSAVLWIRHIEVGKVTSAK